MPRGGARRNSGPKPGVKSMVRAEIDRFRGEFAKTAAPDAVAQITVSQATVAQVTFDALEHLCTVAAMFLDQAAEQHKLLEEKSTEFDRGFYAEMLCGARDTCKEIVKYQRPTYRAILTQAAPAEERDDTKRFTLTVFEGGRKIEAGMTPPGENEE